MQKRTLLITGMLLITTLTAIFPLQNALAAEPVLSNPVPTGGKNATYNPRFTITVSDSQNHPLTVYFRTNRTGSWETLGTYHGGNQQYVHNTTNFDIKNTKYYWSVNATDGTLWKNGTYSFIAQPFVLKWRKQTYANYSGQIYPTTSVGPLAADIDNDGIYEIFTTGNYTATCVNGLTGAVIWRYNDPEIDYHSPFEIGDLNNDGIPEMVISCNETMINNGYTIALHANTGQQYWRVRQESGGKYLAIVDTDGNNYPYVYITSGDYLHGANGYGRLRKLNGQTGAVLKQTFLYRPCWGGVSVADAENDGKLELYVNERKANYNSYTFVNGTRVPVSLGQLNLGMMCYDAETLDLLWYQDSVTASSHPLELIDVDGDGVLDAVSLQQNGGGAYVVDGATWDKMPGFYQDSVDGMHPHSPFPLYDVDNDGKIEIIVNADGPARMWDLGQWDSYITIGTLNYTEPPKMADVIGDSTLEIIGSSTGTKIYDPQGNLIESIINCYGLDTQLVQDIDNDGQNELIVLAGTGYINCYDTSAYAPTPRVRTNIQLYSERRTGVGIYIPPPGAPQPIIKTVIPVDAAADVTFNPTLRVRMIDYHHDRMDITISTNASGSWTPIATYTDVGNGWYNTTTTGMNVKNKTYYWRVTATDPNADQMTTTQTFRFTTLASPQITNVIATPIDTYPNTPVNISCNVIDGGTVETVKVRVTAPNGAISNLTADGGIPGWTVLRYDDFESGMGSYTDGGNFCAISTDSGYVYQGNRAVKIENFQGLESSFYLKQPIDVDTPRYTSIKVDFWFKARNMSNLSNFWVKFNDGQHWRIVDNYIKPGAQGYRPTDKPFENDTFYHAITWINESKYTFPTNMKIRFECDANGAAPCVFIDQVYINATTAQGPLYYLNSSEYSRLGTYQYFVYAEDVSGNTIRSSTQTFRISTNPHPYQPDDPNPANDSTKVPVTKDLSWTGGSPGSTVTYDIYFGTSNQPSLIANNHTTTTYDVGPMSYSTTYYWRIVAWDAQSNFTAGPLWHFKTTAQSGGGGGGGNSNDDDEPTTQPINVIPIANTSAGEPYQGYINEPVFFNGSRSNDSDGTIEKWNWNFGDNTTGSGKTITHIYTSIGLYNVTLIVTDNNSTTGLTSTTCDIRGRPNQPHTAPIINGPLNGTVNVTCNFTVTSTDLDKNDTIHYSIIWGDETSYSTDSGILPSNTSFTASHYWTVPGNYTITVTAFDNHNLLKNNTFTIRIDPKPEGSPGFELILILCALTLAAILLRKKKRTN